MRFKIAILTVTFLVLAAVSAPVRAPIRADDRPNRPCRADIEKFCKEAERGGRGQIGKCLAAHRDEVSMACKGKLAQASEKNRSFHTDCRADEEKFCRDVVKGPGHKMKCLKSHEGEVSTACKGHLARMTKRPQ